MVTATKNYVGRQYLSADGIQHVIPLLDVYTDAKNTPTQPALSSILAYRVQILASKGTIANIIAQPCAYYPSGSPDCSATDQGSIQINAFGNLQNTQALKTVNVLWQLPSSGVFNYVLFTEGSIVPSS